MTRPAENGKPETCPNGHPRTAENTYIAPTGKRQCRVCRLEAERRRTTSPKTNRAGTRAGTQPNPPRNVILRPLEMPAMKRIREEGKGGKA